MSDSQFKRLYRSSTDKKVAGVCGGIAEYVNADPTIIRLAVIVLTVVSGFVPGIIAYAVAAVIMPATEQPASTGPAKPPTDLKPPQKLAGSQK